MPAPLLRELWLRWVPELRSSTHDVRQVNLKRSAADDRFTSAMTRLPLTVTTVDLLRKAAIMTVCSCTGFCENMAAAAGARAVNFSRCSTE